MSRFLLSVLVLFTTLAAFAQQTPIVTDLQPNQGPSDGGTLVVVRGDHLSTKVVCILPCPPRVQFGDVTVDAVEESDERLVVTTPAHAPGVVDVTVFIPGEEPFLLKNGFTFVGDGDEAYEQVLLPIYLKELVPGANGSQWRTDFRIRNHGTEAVLLAPWECPPNMACPPVFPLTHTLLPNRTLHNPQDFSSRPGANPSRLLYVSKPDAVSMSLRVGDVSRSTLNAGTDLPIVRPHELLRGTAQLFDVPLDAQSFRILLRVYDLAYTKADFEVRLYDERREDEPVHVTLLTATTPQQGAFRSEAAYAQLDITDLLKLRKAWPATARIEILPRTPGSRYWAFVSLTNNQTQLVTLVTPQ
ncbi:MAG TPA: IPT/TIG domain-containing protein [Thermoanaerobaculia bacterium]|nr:IPT/TIG domain-containing protein [Thermoanaerobaculia bacterium]